MPPLGPIPPGPNLTFFDRVQTVDDDDQGMRIFSLEPSIRTIQQRTPDPKYWSELDKDTTGNGWGINHASKAPNHEIVGPFYGKVYFGNGDDNLRLKDFSGKAYLYMTGGDDLVSINPSVKAPHDIEVHGGEGFNMTRIHSKKYAPGQQSTIKVYDQSKLQLWHSGNEPPFIAVPKNQWTKDDIESGLDGKYTNNHGMTIYAYKRPGNDTKTLLDISQLGKNK